MEGVPRNIQYQELRRDLKSIDGVCNVHSLHIWSLTLDRNAIAVHLAIGKYFIFPKLSHETCLNLLYRGTNGYRKGAINCHSALANQIWNCSLHGPSRTI